MQQLKKEFVEMVANDPELQGKIAKATNKSVQAVEIWGTKPNHERLIMKPVLNAIKDYIGAPSEEYLLEEAA